MLTWYIPTFHGDITLESEGDSTLVKVTDLTPSEEAALRKLRKRSVSPGWGRKPWAKEKDFEPAESAAYRTREGATVRLKAPIEEVQRFLSRALKPDRSLLSVVRFRSGAIEESRLLPAYRTPAPPADEDPKKEDPKKEPKAAVTVAKPVAGCPVPDFPQATLRANRVLEAFLDEGQVEDFRSRNQFVTVGADSGHRYLVTSRESPLIRRYGRSLFDVDRDAPICTHDWTVPAAEEMLALHLFLSVPGQETYLITLPGAQGEEDGLGPNPHPGPVRS